MQTELIKIPNMDYAISINGEIKSYKTNKFLVVHPCHKGYFRIRLIGNNGQRKTYAVHRLVATVYIPNPENLPQVNHIDGNKQNNHASNLEWCTNLINMQHSWKNGLHAHTKEQDRKQSLRMRSQIGDKSIRGKAVVNNAGHVFPTAKLASQSINRGHARVSAAIRNNQVAGGYTWRYLNGDK